MDEARNAVHGFVALDDLDSQYLTAQEAADIDDFPAEEVMTAIGRMRLFVVNGSRPAADPVSSSASMGGTLSAESGSAAHGSGGRNACA